MKHSERIEIRDLMNRLGKIPGGYNYDGACSTQICFPLKSGGELRFMSVDDDCNEPREGDIHTSCGVFNIDFYSGAVPPGVTGPAYPTGQTKQ